MNECDGTTPSVGEAAPWKADAASGEMSDQEAVDLVKVRLPAGVSPTIKKNHIHTPLIFGAWPLLSRDTTPVYKQQPVIVPRGGFGGRACLFCIFCFYII